MWEQQIPLLKKSLVASTHGVTWSHPVSYFILCHFLILPILPCQDSGN